MVKAKITVGKTKGPPVGFSNLSDMSVLVGIPAGSTRRGGGINNAEVLFIFSKGSPLKRIPARPVIEPAIEANAEFINKELAKASSAALNNDPAGVQQGLQRAGMVAANASKEWFFDSRNGWAPNTPGTIRAKGSAQPGIDTGAMRRAITYVVRGTFRKKPEPEKKSRQQELEAPEEAPETKAARARGASEGASLAEEAAEAGELLL
jgi:hypothetical protein